MKNNLYLIPGLGLDHRVFARLNLKNSDIHYLDWIEPDQGEGLESYAKRLAEKIVDSSSAIIVGHSFGGMIALKIADLLNIKKVILISSAKSKKEIPHTLKILRWLPLYKLYSDGIRDKMLPYWSRLFGIKTKEDLKFFKEMLRNNSQYYREWAISNA
ncbi:MAG: alpha/beta fold hydrolase, partial [Bacteroidia bacterium]|nr:alpha/beta fold hydrolase [Bacteroidia bacterium]